MNKALVKLLFGWPLSFLALFFLGQYLFTHTASLSTQIQHFTVWYLLLAVCFFLLYFFLRALLWQKILLYQGHTLAFRKTALLWSLSEIKRYVPGNIWGLLGRVQSFSQEGIASKSIITALAVEAVFIVVGSIVVSLLCAKFLYDAFLPSFPLKEQAFYVGCLVDTILLTTFLFLPHLRKKYLAFLPFPSSLVRVSPYHMTILLGISILSFVAFGIGTYVSILSLFQLLPQYLFLFVGLFTFSYAVGYLSFITPMGLGVREGMMTILLSRFLIPASAIVATLFARIVLTMAEALFVVFLLSGTITRHIRKLLVQLSWQKHKYFFFLFFFFLCYTSYFTTASFLRYDNFYTGRFDLGNMDQTVWNTLHGNIFQFTDPDGTTIISRLSFHADFILILLAPFYFFWQDPRMLLLIQTVVLGMGGLFVFGIANHVLKKQSLALLFALCYFLNPSLGYTNLYDFHAVSLATTFLLASWYFLLKKKPFLLILSLILAGMTKEQVWLTVSFFGLFLCLQKTKRLLGITLIGLGISLFYILVWQAIPASRGAEHFALSYYSDFGNSPTSIVKNILFEPQKIISIVLQPDRVGYLQKLFLPLGYLPVFFPFFLLLCSPDFIINLLSNNNQLHQIYYQYTATITPFLLLSTIYALSFLHKRLLFLPRWLLPSYLLVMSLVGFYCYSPLPFSKHPNIDMFTKPLADREEIASVLEKIPETYSVAASNNIGSHLSHRQLIFTIPLGMQKADILVFLLTDSFAQPSLSAQEQMVHDLKKNPTYHIIHEKGPFIIFQKKPY